MSADVAVVDVLYVNGNSVQLNPKVNGKSVHSEHWSKIPDSVLFDGRISFAARCVYATLAGSAHRGGTATIGQRRVAGLLGSHQETVLLAIRELEKVGHVELIGSGQARRGYRLMSGLSGSAADSVPEGHGSGRTQRRVKPSLICPKCHQKRHGLLRVGWCRPCNWNLKVRKLAREEARDELARAAG